jgi:hypothetical protein
VDVGEAKMELVPCGSHDFAPDRGITQGCIHRHNSAASFVAGNETSHFDHSFFHPPTMSAAPKDERIAVPIDDPNADTEW